MAQHRSSTVSWAAYLSNPAVQRGWQAYASCQPFDQARIDCTLYTMGRHMAAESGLPCPRKARKMNPEIVAVLAAIPEAKRIIATHHALRREENKRRAALVLALHRHKQAKVRAAA